MATMVAVADAVATVAVVVLGPEAMAEVARQAEIQVRVVEPTEAVGTERCRAGTAALKVAVASGEAGMGAGRVVVEKEGATAVEVTVVTVAAGWAPIPASKEQANWVAAVVAAVPKEAAEWEVVAWAQYLEEMEAALMAVAEGALVGELTGAAAGSVVVGSA